jgi:hypothetical protein
LGLFYGHWDYFMTIWYILCSFGKFLPALVSCTKKNLATLTHTQAQQKDNLYLLWVVHPNIGSINEQNAKSIYNLQAHLNLRANALFCYLKACFSETTVCRATQIRSFKKCVVR